MAMPVLWCAFQPGLEYMLSTDVCARIRHAYESICPEDFHADWNPIVKVPLVVTRVENSLCIDGMLVLNPDQAPDAPGDPQVPEQQVLHAQALNGHTAQMQACLNQVHLCWQQLLDAHNQALLSELRAWLVIKFEVMKINVNSV